ncbi:MAG: glycosyl hydrolase family 8 [Liquorilactobacillus mali]|uniref:glycosyl hydrolase family 8 n=1 Tax=Liquorilactobacillus mali TaxID=1618 RepID=UPI0039E78052
MEIKKNYLIVGIVTCLILIVGIIFLKNNMNETSYSKIYQKWQREYIVKNGEGSFVNTVKAGKKQALSEAQGYGMVITMLAAKKKYTDQSAYDKLVAFYTKNTIPGKKFMYWKLVEKEDKWENVDQSNATDGDLDIAYSLILADQMWGSTGKYNYRQMAKQILSDLLTSNYNQRTHLLRVGNWATDSSGMGNLIRTSDLIPSYYKTFYQYTHNETWRTIYYKSIDVLGKLSNQNSTGLFPDFAWINGNDVAAAEGKVIEKDTDGDYSWNACRIPLRLSLVRDKRLRKINDKLLTFFNKQRKIEAGYSLNGQTLANYQSMAFLAPIGVAANLQKSKFPQLAKELKKQILQTKLTGNYYGDTLQTYSAMVLANQRGVQDSE